MSEIACCIQDVVMKFRVSGTKVLKFVSCVSTRRRKCTNITFKTQLFQYQKAKVKTSDGFFFFGGGRGGLPKTFLLTFKLHRSVRLGCRGQKNKVAMRRSHWMELERLTDG